MSALLIVSMGWAGGGPDGSEGQYLAEFEPDAFNGRGFVRWTLDKAKAMRFADLWEATRCWQTQSAAVPLRDDGHPNRPLTAYSVTFETDDG